MRPFSRSLFRPRRDLDELGKLFFGQRRIDELELDRVPLNPRHVLHLVRLQCLFRLKFLDRVCNQVRIELHLLGIHRNRLGIRIHPIDGLAIALDETHDRVALAIFNASALTMMVRTVCPRSEGASLPRMRIRIFPSLSSFTPNGGAAQPISIWPDMTWVSVAAGPPVGVGLALTPSSSTNASTRLLELEPLVE